MSSPQPQHGVDNGLMPAIPSPTREGAPKALGNAELAAPAGTPTAPPDPQWLVALRGAVKENPRGAAGVAEAMGVSRGYVSQVLNGHWPKVPQAFVVRVVERLCATACPHLGREITHAQCRDFAARQWTQISQFEVDHWLACQGCTARAPAASPTPLPPKPSDWVFVPRKRRQRQGGTAQAPCQQPECSTPPPPQSHSAFETPASHEGASA